MSVINLEREYVLKSLEPPPATEIFFVSELQECRLISLATEELGGVERNLNILECCLQSSLRVVK